MEKLDCITIDLALMERYSLSFRDAMYLDMVAQLIGGAKTRFPGWCMEDHAFFAQVLKVTPRTIANRTQHLAALGLMEVERGGTIRRTTKLFDDCKAA